MMKVSLTEARSLTVDGNGFTITIDPHPEGGTLIHLQVDIDGLVDGNPRKLDIDATPGGIKAHIQEKTLFDI